MICFVWPGTSAQSTQKVWNWQWCGVSGSIQPQCSMKKKWSSSQTPKHEICGGGHLGHFHVGHTISSLFPYYSSFCCTKNSSPELVILWQYFTISYFSHCFFMPFSRFLSVDASTLQKFASLVCFSITDRSTKMQLNYRTHSFKSWKYPYLDWYFSPPASPV